LWPEDDGAARKIACIDRPDRRLFDRGAGATIARAGVGRLVNRRKGSGMGKSRYAAVLVPAVAILAALALPASAQMGGGNQPPPKGAPKAAPQKAAPVQRGPAMGARPAGPQQGGRTVPQQGYRQGPQQGYRQGGLGAGGRAVRAERRAWGGHAYYGRQAWDRGRWRHEMRNGRYGWWWDVGGAYYYYDQRMDGPPGFVSDVEVMEDPDAGPPPDEAMPADAYPPPPAVYVPPPPVYVAPPPVVCVGPLCIR
jgi:hypothetical protein